MTLLLLLVFLGLAGIVLLILLIVGLVFGKKQLSAISGFLLIGCIMGGIWVSIELTRDVVEFASEVADNANDWIEEELEFHTIEEQQAFLQRTCTDALNQLDTALCTDTLLIRTGKVFAKVWPPKTACYFQIDATPAFMDSLRSDMEAVSWESIKADLTPATEWAKKVEWWHVERMENMEHYRAITGETEDGHAAIYVAIDRETNTVFINAEMELE